ncbi:MAG: hypothetical protein [Bacteriophage sp.]|nr:MAG: hypothetical protein [Bacteriophage sp.]
MQVIEKVKVVPEGYNGAGMNYDGGNRRDVNGKANAGLTLGIIGTALGGLALFGNRRSTPASILGGAGGGMLGDGSTNINVLGATAGSGSGAPTAFQARAIMNNIDSFDKFLKPIADKDGMIDIEGIFDEEYEAKEVVEQMYHVKDNKKYVGEKYDMNKAHEICERYKEVLPNDVEPCDVYVAINAQYHDYAKLFEEWFGGNIDNKVFESAITFWFKDVDFDGDKVWEYFHMNN